MKTIYSFKFESKQAYQVIITQQAHTACFETQKKLSQPGKVSKFEKIVKHTFKQSVFCQRLATVSTEFCQPIDHCFQPQKVFLLFEPSHLSAREMRCFCVVLNKHTRLGFVAGLLSSINVNYD